MCFSCSAVVSFRRSKTPPPGFSSVASGSLPAAGFKSDLVPLGGSLLLVPADFGLSLFGFAFCTSCFVAVVGLDLGVSCFPLVVVPLSDTFAPSADWTANLEAEEGVSGVDGVSASGGGAIVCTENQETSFELYHHLTNI